MRAVLLAAMALAIGAVVGCGASAPSSNYSANSPSGVSQSVAQGWAAKWCSAQPGITKEGLYAVMGKPTGELSDQASWDAYDYQFNAFFAADGTVRQLDINDYSLTVAEKAALTCATTRKAQ